MNLKLEIIPLDADLTQPAFASDDCQLLLKMWKEYYPTIGFHLPWVGYMVKQEEEIIGCCSFNGPPVEDSVEISYWTFKPFEGRGIASFSCKQLIAIAREENSTVTIFAKTAPEKNASTSVLEKCGFHFTRIVQDHEIGDAWEWVLK